MVMKNKPWFSIIAAIVVIIAMFSGCLYDPEETDTNENTSSATNSTESSVISDTMSDTSATTTEAPESTAETTTTPTTTSAPQTTTEANTTKAETKAEHDYVLNTNTMKFHYPTCSSFEDIKTNNREDYHGTREDVVAQGFSPCGRCKP